MVSSKHALLTNTTKLDFSDIMVSCCHLRFPFFWLRMGWKMLCIKKVAFSISI